MMFGIVRHRLSPLAQQVPVVQGWRVDCKPECQEKQTREAG
ncbi:hypothetical protein [Escherichia coli]|nr:hypothetical protein [Escherichia coli]MCW7295988.1 hypothetical protein [Escherichia coli]